jgi:hypothetical protein
MRYVAPCSAPRRAPWVEPTLLAAANSVLLVSAGIAVANTLSPLDDPYPSCCLLAFLGLAAIAQLAILTRRYMVLPGVIWVAVHRPWTLESLIYPIMTEEEFLHFVAAVKRTGIDATVDGLTSTCAHDSRAALGARKRGSVLSAWRIALVGVWSGRDRDEVAAGFWLPCPCVGSARG